MKVWITKYALTSGISEHEAEGTHTRDMVKYGPHSFAHGEGKDWHRTHESALTRAEDMRVAKLNSMRKRMAELEALRFDADARKSASVAAESRRRLKTNR